jgi:hypothetical protein
MLRLNELAIMGRVLLSGLAIAAVFWATGQASAQTDAVTVEEVRTASVKGFRTAMFGMGEAAVSEAIIADFGVETADITASNNAVERTRLLTVSVPDLLEGGGRAQVSYIFGYKSEALIQVGVSWNAQIDPETTGKQLVANGDVLSAHFLDLGFAPETVTINSPVANGILLFRGLDPDGAAAILLMQGTYEEIENGQNSLNPTGLALLYSVDPDAPDIFRLKEGSF